MESLFSDIRYAARNFVKRPGFSDFSYPLYVTMRDSSPEFEGMLADSDSNFGLSAGDQIERLRGE
jgi:hypothetical protein